MDYKEIAKSLLACANRMDCENCAMPNNTGCANELNRKAAAAIAEQQKEIADLLNRAESAEKKLTECEPKHGHWIPRDFDITWGANRYECSKCGRSIHILPVLYASEIEQVCKQFPYCHCGAKMDEEV